MNLKFHLYPYTLKLKAVQKIRPFLSFIKTHCLLLWCSLVSYKRVRRFLKNYNHPLKLNLGCGNYPIEGWINVDLRSKGRKEVLPVNMLRKLPFADSTFRFCHSEHVLEHFSITELRFILKEALRILTGGGIFRLSVPDLNVMISNDLRSNDWVNIKKTLPLTKDMDLPTGTHFLNYTWDAWGHKFNHTYESMAYELKNAGFSKINVVNCGDSAFPELRNLEMRKETKSLILEATK